MGFLLLFFFLRDIGREFQTLGPKTEKDLVLKASREKPGVKRAQRLRGRVWLKKARRIIMEAYCTDRHSENRDKQFSIGS